MCAFQAFKAAESLGVPPLLNPQEMVEGSTPDKLFVMTYVFQLKLHLDKGLERTSLFTKQKRQERLAFQVVEATRNAVTDGSESSSSSESDTSDEESGEGEVYYGTEDWRPVSRTVVEVGEPKNDEEKEAAGEKETNKPVGEDAAQKEISEGAATAMAEIQRLAAQKESTEPTKASRPVVEEKNVPKTVVPSVEGGNVPSMYASVSKAGNISNSSSEDELQVFTEGGKKNNKPGATGRGVSTSKVGYCPSLGP